MYHSSNQINPLLQLCIGLISFITTVTTLTPNFSCLYMCLLCNPYSNVIKLPDARMCYFIDTQTHENLHIVSKIITLKYVGMLLKQTFFPSHWIKTNKQGHYGIASRWNWHIHSRQSNEISFKSVFVPHITSPLRMPI